MSDAACVCGQRDAERYPDATDRVIVPSAADCPVHGTPAAKVRDPDCVERWPECEDGAYHPNCCRFPKSCSCTVYTPPSDAAANTELGC